MNNVTDKNNEQSVYTKRTGYYMHCRIANLRSNIEPAIRKINDIPNNFRPDQMNLLLLGFTGPFFALFEKSLNAHAQCRPLTEYCETLTFTTCS